MTTKNLEKKNKDFDYKNIKTFEDACKKENIDPEKLPGVNDLPEDLKKPIIAVYKLFIIFLAINNGWKPDWSNSDQYKYYPWYWVLSSGFGFDFSHYLCPNSSTGVGSRLCTDTSDKAKYIANQFEKEYQEYLLYSEN